MTIFNSYVSLPEGIQSIHIHSYPRGISEHVQTLEGHDTVSRFSHVETPGSLRVEQSSSVQRFSPWLLSAKEQVR